MPIYKFVCKECNVEEDNVFVKTWEEKHLCSRCKKPMQKAFSGVAVPNTFPSDGIFLEHVCPEGKRFFSKKEMKDYAKANDLEIDYLE